MQCQFKTSGVCSRRITFTLDEQNKIHDVAFEGGCNGNAKGVSALVEGMDADDAIRRLKGITCGYKPTSCPDQLAQALEAAEAQK